METVSIFYVVGMKAYSELRYKVKPFMNKTGPIFDKKKEDLSGKVKSHRKRIEEIKQESLKEDKEVKSKKDQKQFSEAYMSAKVGYSLGVKPASERYRKKRKEKYNELMESFRNIFGLENITNENARGYRRERSAVSQRITKAKFQYKRNPNIQNNLRRQEEQREIKTKHLEEKYERLQENKKQYDIAHKPKPTKPRVVKEMIFPQIRDVTKGFILENRNFTMGARSPSQFGASKTDPEIKHLGNYFDEVRKHPKFAYDF